MKNFYKLLGIGLSFSVMTLISGCGGGSTSTTTASTGTVLMNITDAPVDDENVLGVHIAFDAIHYKPADAEWVVEELNETRVINLLELQNGASEFLAQTELPTGHINQVRFMIDTDQCVIELADEGNVSLTVPSGEQTGYKAVGGFVVAAGGEINVTADFDVRKSLVLDANGYKLKPTIRIVDNSQIGEINGTINTDGNTSAVIYAYTDGTWDEATETSNDFANAVTSSAVVDGSFTLPWLSAGIYDLAVVEVDNTGGFSAVLGVVEDVDVSADGKTNLDIDINNL